MTTCLKTKRLMMRNAQPSDIEGYHEIASDYEVVKWLSSWPWPADRDYTASRCVPLDPAFGVLGPVFHKDEMVGVIGLATYEGAPAMLGYMFKQHYWGRGFATEMVQSLIAHCWAIYDWPFITSEVFDSNDASVRVLTNLGFHCVGKGSTYCNAQHKDMSLRRFMLERPSDFTPKPL